jgi:hypothetical protein
MEQESIGLKRQSQSLSQLKARRGEKYRKANKEAGNCVLSSRWPRVGK